jgi:hypothetical protein
MHDGFESVREETAAMREDLGGTLRQILKAVEVGSERRDGRVDGLEKRVQRLEEHTGLTPPKRH